MIEIPERETMLKYDDLSQEQLLDRLENFEMPTKGLWNDK